MARIRTIKPDFWTDEKIVELSFQTRLLFIGMWNFADDHGGIEGSHAQLKMRIFPADSVDIDKMIEELTTHGLLIEYSVNGQKYYHIRKFTDHQKINRPSKPRCPAYNSRSPHGRKGSGSGSGSGRERKLILMDDAKASPVTNEKYIENVKNHYNAMIEDPKETAQWRQIYNGKMDIDRLLFAACTWLVDHPEKRKTKLKQFYGNWLRNHFQRSVSLQ